MPWFIYAEYFGFYSSGEWIRPCASGSTTWFNWQKLDCLKQPEPIDQSEIEKQKDSINQDAKRRSQMTNPQYDHHKAGKNHKMQKGDDHHISPWWLTSKNVSGYR
jgi:hypothetical protein